MSLKDKKIGIAFTGSFCTFGKAFNELSKIANTGAKIQTIFRRILYKKKAVKIFRFFI